MDAHETLLTPNEAAEILRLSPFTIANMLRAGALPGQKLGRLWRIRLPTWTLPSLRAVRPRQ